MIPRSWYRLQCMGMGMCGRKVDRKDYLLIGEAARDRATRLSWEALAADNSHRPVPSFVWCYRQEPAAGISGYGGCHDT